MSLLSACSFTYTQDIVPPGELHFFQLPFQPYMSRGCRQPSILLHPNNGGRKLFGYSDADLTTGMIQMSRMGLTSRTVDRLQIICNQNKRLSTSPGVRNNTSGDGGQRGGGGGGGVGTGGAAAGGEDRHGPTGGPAAGTRVQTAPGGSGIGSGPTKHGRRPSGRLAMTEDGEGGERTEETLGGGGWGDGGEGAGAQDGGVGDNDHSQILKIKAAQALFRMSLETGEEVGFGVDHLAEYGV